jgi:hypothetical protein
VPAFPGQEVVERVPDRGPADDSSSSRSGRSRSTALTAVPLLPSASPLAVIASG